MHFAAPHRPSLFGSRLFDWHLLTLALVLVGVTATRAHGYLLFHSLAELFWIAVALTAFSIAWNTRRHLENGFLRVAGVALGPVAFIAILHTLAYKGMGVFAEADANLPTQLWVATRILEAGGTVAAVLLARRKVSTRLILVLSWLAAAALIAVIFLGVFPDCFVEGQGLTTFKVAAEYAIMAAFGLSLILLRRVRDLFTPHLYRLMMWATALALVQGAAFTLYRDVYGALNMAGHLIAIVYGYLMYAGVVRYGLAHPQQALYHQLDTLNARLTDTALRDNERAALALAAMGAATWEWAMDGPAPSLSPRHQAWLGLACAAAPTLAEWRERVVAEDLPAFDDAVARRLPGATRSAEYRFRQTDGSLAWFLTVSRTFATESGDRMVGLDQDITERRQAELDRARLSEDVRKFSEILAHHLQEPARLQACYAQLLRRHLPSPCSPEIDEAMTVIEDGALTLRRLLRDAHLYIVLDRLPQPAMPVNGDQALQAAWSRLATAIRGCAATLQAAPLPPLPLCADRAIDLFAIVLGNALEYRHPDRPLVVTVTSEAAQGESIITVRDNGIGIEPCYQEQVFTPFERLHTQAQHPGSGIGLALARKIVEAAGGRIWITSEFGLGTSVHVALPRMANHD